jgi:hypothetical protein
VRLATTRGTATVFGTIGLLYLGVIALVLALDVAALTQVWRDGRHSTVVKVIWTVLIAALPVIAVLGWALNWTLGKAADRLDRRTT